MLDVEARNHLEKIKQNLIEKMTEKLKNVGSEQEQIELRNSIDLLSKKV
jgi:hypothetical protein